MYLEILYFTFLLLIIIYLGTFLLVGITLLIRSFKKSFNNLIYAGLAFVLITVAQITDLILNLNLVVDRFFTGFFILLVVIFTNKTFHKEQRSLILRQDRKSYLPNLILIVTLINIFITLVVSFFKEKANSPEIHYIRIIHDTFTFSVAFFWLSISSYHAYLEIKNQYIEPWIKVRYKLLAIMSVIPPILQVIIFLQPWNVRFGSIYPLESFVAFGLTAIISVVLSIGFLITLLMPERIKKILNRNYKPVLDKDFSQEELTEIIKYLGEKLAKKIKLSSTAARGLIKLAIQEQIGVFKQLSHINFKSFKEIIQGTLKDRLIKLEIDNVNDVIDDMFNYLIKIQSLITMGSV